MMTQFTLFSLLILMSGLLFAHRIHHHFKKQNLFTSSLMTKIGTFYFLSFLSLYILLFNKPFQLWFAVMGLLILLPILVFIFKKLHQQHFCSEFLRFLSVVTLKMQMGYSFRSSYELGLHSQRWRHAPLLVQILENVVFSQQEFNLRSGPLGRLLLRIENELSLVYKHQHQAIDRLCKFRKNFQAEQFFRRKSRQIWMYFAYQLGLLTVIYSSLLIYIANQYEIFQLKKVYLLSLSFYFLGVFFVFLICRGQKWHI